jgi:phenylalanyl-tRNA synthetase beta chain
MKVSLNWLKKYTRINLSVDALVAAIGAQLGAVEEVIDMHGMYEGIAVVKITEVKPHPNADRLNIYQITNGKEQVQVVSGDQELKVGDKVAWLAPGTTVPITFHTEQPVVLEAREMRGQMSHGMFGSGRELVINDDHERVLVLDTSAAPGTLLAKAYELDDIIIDIENKMFTHRPDCFGIIGVAREIAGIQGKRFRSPLWYTLPKGKIQKPDGEPKSLVVDNQLPALCPAYHTAVISDVQVKPSPLNVQSYLKRVGIRPINNIVDATNYLMYLTGQPLHAFDYDKVAAVDDRKTPALTVRHPKKDETLTLLDGRTIVPHKDAILIASRKKALALGGVMGGQETEIDANTKNIILEAATFDMYSIRRSSMEHGIFTDAVTRFSKGQSAEQTGVVLVEAMDLVRALAGGRISSEFGVAAPTYHSPIDTSVNFINQHLGSHLRPNQMRQLLENVELQVILKQDRLRLASPFWRTDLEIPEDIIEEVGRLFGYDKLRHDLPLRTIAAVQPDSIQAFISSMREYLAAAGNNELQTYSFVSEALLHKTGQNIAEAYKLRNALSPELRYIRTSLTPSLLDKVHANHKAGYGQFGLFEFGKSHSKQEIGEDSLPKERRGLSFLFSADKKTATQYAGAPFYQAKYQLSVLFDQLMITNYSLLPLSELPDVWWLQNLAHLFEPKRAAQVVVDGKPVGIVGEYKSSIQTAFKLPSFIAGFEIHTELLHSLHRPTSLYRPMLRFPAIEQDISFKVKQDVAYGSLKVLLEKQFVDDQRLRVTVLPVDIYQAEKARTYKHFTYRLRLQHHDRTLTMAEVNDIIETTAIEARKQYQAERL